MKTQSLPGFFFACVAWFVILSTGLQAADRPNVVLILADDLGWADTTLYGKTSFYETPNLERLAARGMTFSNAYSASPICSPTRASIMTGQNPARHGMTAPAAHLPEVRFEPIANTKGASNQKSTIVKSATRIDPSIRTLAQLLKDAGYSTAHFGKWHLGTEPHSPLEVGFDVDIPHWHGPGPKTSYLAPWGYENPDFEEGKPGDHIEDRMAEEAVLWLKNRDKTRPFFMNYWQFSVHAPFGAKLELIDHYRPKIDRDSEQQSPTYAAMVHSLDDAVGTLLDALEAEEVLDETILVFYSDNGGNIHCGLEETDASGENYVTAITSNAPLRGGKGGIHEGGIRVPAVVAWPGNTEAGSRSETRIQSNDLYPTILRMVGLPIPGSHPIDGVDFTAALGGQEMERPPMFTYVPSYGNTPQWLPPSMAVHHGDWKLIRTFHHGEDGAHQYRLYNLRDDIGENENLAGSNPEIVETLDKVIEDYLAEAEVVVPLPNPNFDPAKFDASLIGVQAGGLKMPKGKKPPGELAPLKTVKLPAMLGWTAKGADVSVDNRVLSLTATKGRKPILVRPGLRVEGPTEVTMRIRAKTGGDGRLQWRTDDQELFPDTGQLESFAIQGGDWQEVTVPLAVDGRLVHLRFFPPGPRQRIEIDWIEIGSERFDFGANEVAETSMPKGAKPKPRTRNQGPRAAAKLPNIVLILADDLGYGELGCYGSPDAKTPNMDQLAAEGVRCTDGYSAFPVCSPSRAAILTGRYPQRFGDTYEDYYGGGSPSLNPEDHPTIGQLLQEVGYRTACFGKWNVSNLERRRANDFGFDAWVGLHLNHDFYTHKLLRTGELDMYRDGTPYPDRAGTWSDTVFADEAIQFIRDVGTKNEARGTKHPFFVFLPFQAPHTPIQDPDVPMDAPQEKNRPTLIKMIERLDLEVGRVLQALEDQNVSDNTLVILTSDNGGEQKVARNLPLGGAKQMLEEGGIRVPYILRWPGVLPEGKVYRTPVTAYDLTATIAAAGSAEARPDKPFDGVDLVPAFTGSKKLAADRPIFFRRRNITVHRGENAIRQSAVRQGDWKYLRTYKPVGSNRYRESLYNLRDDIGEENNLITSHPERLNALSTLLDRWEEEVDSTGLAFEDVPLPSKRKDAIVPQEVRKN